MMGLGKAKTATSPFQTLKEFRVNLGALGHGIASSDGSTLNNWYMASPEIAAAQKNALGALNTNLAVFRQAPSQQLSDLDRGQNAFYNVSKEQMNKELATQMGQAQLKFSRQGLQDSTTSGAYQGQIASQATLRDLMNRFSSLEYLNDNARKTTALALDAVADFSSLAQSTAAAANANMMAAYGDRSQTGQFNAAQKNQMKQSQLNSLTRVFTSPTNIFQGSSSSTSAG